MSQRSISRICLIAIVCAAAVGAFAQTSTSAIQTQPAAATTFRIAGTVVNALTEEPLRRATVAVLSKDNDQIVKSVETDNEGRFELAGLAAAKYPLTASKRGFLTAFYNQHDEGYNSAIVTGEGQETTGLVLKLTPGASIHGLVAGDGGDPVEGAKGMLFVKPHNHNPWSRITQASETITDDTGAYEFDGLAAGEYLLAVKAEPWYAMHGVRSYRPSRSASEPNPLLDVAYPIAFFDSTTDEGSATGIKVTGGSREEANINLHAVPALRLLVLGPARQDGSLANPELRTSVFGTQIRTESNGLVPGTEANLFDFTVAPGRYELAQGDPPRIVELDATTSQQIDPSLGRPTVAVSGTLLTPNGSGLPESLSVMLTPDEGSQSGAPLQANCAKGSFTFDAVRSGSWRLIALATGKTLAVSSIKAGKKTQDGDLFSVAEKPLQLEVLVTVGETRVEGFAKKLGKGLAGVMIVLVPRNPTAHSDQFRRDQSDSDGSFALRDVAPGEYTVVAIDDGWELDWARPEVIARYLSKGVAVTVSANSGKLMKLSEGVPVQSR